MSDFEDWVTDVEEELIDHYDDFRNKNPALVQRRALDARAACKFIDPYMNSLETLSSHFTDLHLNDLI